MLKYEFHIQPGASPSDTGYSPAAAPTARPATRAAAISTPLGPAGLEPVRTGRSTASARPSEQLRARHRNGRFFRPSAATNATTSDIDPGVRYDVPGRQRPREQRGISVTRPATSSPAPRSRPRRFPTTTGAFPHRRGPELLRRVRLEAQRRRHRAHHLTSRRRQPGLRQQAGRRRGQQRLRHGHHGVPNFPTTNAFDRTQATRTAAVLRTHGRLLFKLNGWLRHWSPTWVARHGRRAAFCQIDRSSNAYVTSETRRATTTTAGRSRAPRVATTTFVTKLNPTGSGDRPSGGTAVDNGGRSGRRRRQRVPAGRPARPTPDHAGRACTHNGAFDAR